MSDTQRQWDEIRQKVRAAITTDVMSEGLDTLTWSGILMEGVVDQPPQEQINILAATVGITTRMITLIFNLWANLENRDINELMAMVWALMAEQETQG